MSCRLLIYILIINVLHPLYEAGPTFYISHYDFDLFLHSAAHNQQIRGRGWEQARKCEDQGAWEGEAEREQGREHCVPESQCFLMQLSAAFGHWGWKPGVAPTAEVHSGHQSLCLVDAVEALPTTQARLSSHPLMCLVHPPPRLTSAVCSRGFSQAMLM